MNWHIPWAMFAAAGGHGGEGHEESLADVIIHHISNAPIHGLEQYGISKAVVCMVVPAVLLTLVLGVAFRKSKLAQDVPSGLTSALEALVLFIRDDLAILYMGEKWGRRFTPFLCTLFFFILSCNLFGMFPYPGYSATGNLNVTAALALLTLVLVLVYGIAVQGISGYIKHMVPDGTPLLIAPAVVLIELFGTLVSKPAALTIRLGANMTAGHIVILVMLGFIFIFKSIVVGLFLSVPMAVAISLLEIIVAFIQAYVFTLLTTLFIGMVVQEAHH